MRFNKKNQSGNRVITSPDFDVNNGYFMTGNGIYKTDDGGKNWILWHRQIVTDTEKSFFTHPTIFVTGASL
jgi:photosystem II stability/assembly factor-like uncharacterized protein